jgi:hypothetical protein
VNQAKKVLREYYRSLVSDIAQDIIDHADDFEAGSLGNADSILDKHARRLCDLSNVFAHLTRFGPEPKPAAKKPLRAGQFRCFSCGGVIEEKDEKCGACGWSWVMH